MCLQFLANRYLGVNCWSLPDTVVADFEPRGFSFNFGFVNL
jgi:hypothetical protein